MIRVDTKKEMVGDFANGGEGVPAPGQPGAGAYARLHGQGTAKSDPPRVYDVAASTGWVNVGTDHDTAAFAVESIRRWWKAMGRAASPHTRRLLIIPDAGGTNSYGTRRGTPSSPPWRWKPSSPSRCATSRLAPAWHLQMEQDRRTPLREAPVERDEDTGEYRLLAGRWHTCFPARPAGSE